MNVGIVNETSVLAISAMACAAPTATTRSLSVSNSFNCGIADSASVPNLRMASVAACRNNGNGSDKMRRNAGTANLEFELIRPNASITSNFSPASSVSKALTSDGTEVTAAGPISPSDWAASVFSSSLPVSSCLVSVMTT